ncbi:MAG: tetratricopeptide repeat protein [Bacteroidaceae bacterium]|nr:tetratricopeptide repeat protein [Bacteroidaceae bacterium]MEE0119681.1 tetratricopeptide repeat protein [Bacteroidaceae bacterium]
MTEEEYIAQGDTAWKEQDWKRCLDSYAEAIALNPESLAKEKREMVMQIIRFFNKDMLNP